MTNLEAAPEAPTEADINPSKAQILAGVVQDFDDRLSELESVINLMRFVCGKSEPPLDATFDALANATQAVWKDLDAIGERLMLLSAMEG